MSDNSFNQSVNNLYLNPDVAPIPSSLGGNDDTPNPMQVKLRKTGVYPHNLPSTLPPPSAGNYNYEADVTATRESLKSFNQSFQDNNEWAKVSSYNPGPSGTYYDRYAPLQEYGKLEFHPLRDNETMMNRNTSFLGDMYRTTTQALIPMVWNGFKSVYSSTAKIFNEGDFLGEDPRLARDYARITAKNYSSKNNLGSFVNNLTMNFGYTVGIMGSALMENWIGAGVAGLTGAKTLSTKAANVLWKEYQAGKAVDGMKAYSTMLDELKDINKVRQAFEEANGIGKFQKAITSPVGRVLNPLSNLTDNYYSILNSTDDFTGLLQTSRNMVNTAGAAYRDFRNINLAVSEARLESGMVYNNMFDDLYREHQLQYGTNPNEEELQDIITQAKQAAYETSFMNAGLIYATNKISFDNILNPRIGAQGFLRQRMLDWKTVGGGRFGELGSVAFDVAKNEWKFAEKGFKTWWNKWKTDPLHKSVWGTVGYFKRNIFEGVQESLQETISAANEKYYKDTFHSAPVRKNLISKAAFGKGTTPLSYYGEGIKEQFSQEGFATFASGFAMGSLAGGLNSSMTFLYEKANQIFDPKTYQEYKTEKTKIVEDLVNSMNAFGVDEMINSRLFNGGVQDILSNVQESGNKKEVMDAESEALSQHFMMLNEYGVLDMYLDTIESYQDMTNAEFKEAFPKIAEEDVYKYKSRIGEVVGKARQIKERMDFYDKVYPNPIDMSKISKDDPDFEQAYIMHHSWNYGVKSAVFYNEVFDDARKRMVNIMNKHYEERPLQGMTKRQSDIILRPEEMKNEAGLLRNEANNLIAVGDPESKKMAKEKLKEAEAYERYVEAYQEFSEYYHRDRYFNRAKSILQSEKAEGEEVTEQEVEQYLDDRFGPKNDEIERDILLNLEAEYNNLLRSISGKPDDYLFTQKVDDAFELVLDFYKLNDESREMVDLINIMNDPKGFLDVYYRNEKWMTDLWLKRGDYYRDIAKQELSNIEDNGLLNHLANQGIFMEASDFVLWRDQGIPPKEFYDERKGLVVPEGSLAYDRYMQTLERYSALKEMESMVTEAAKNSELQIRISQLQERKDKQLEKLEVQFEENLIATTGESKEQWEEKPIPSSEGRTKEDIDADVKGIKALAFQMQEAKTVEEVFDLYNAYAEQGLIPENWAEVKDKAVADNKKEAKKFLKTLNPELNSDEERIRAVEMKFGMDQVFNDRLAELVEEQPAEAQDTTPPIETTDAWKDYQKQVKATNERYDALIQKLKDQLKEAPAETQPTQAAPKKESKKDVDPNATWNELPEDLKNELQVAFDIYLTAPAPGGLGKPADLKRINPSQYEMIRNNWLESQKDMIKAYNERPIDVDSALPNLKYLTPKKSITEYGLTQLRILRDELQSMLDRNKNENGQVLTNQEKSNIKNDINELQKYLTYLRTEYKPKDNKDRVFRIFEEMVLNKQNGVSRILDAEGNTVGYEFPGADGRPMRVTKLTEEIENKMTNKPPFLYEAVQEPYMEGKTQRGGQLLTPFRNLAEDPDIKSDVERLNLFMSFIETTVKDGKLPQLKSQRKIDAIRKALTNNFSEATLIAVVKDIAYDEATIAGNTIDNMTRTAFKIDKDGGFVKPERPAKMSQQAYDNLFGDFGIITELQDSVIDGKYKILSEDVMIFDPSLLESGLVGAMDLVAFDTETGDLKIIDIKTGKEENWKNFNDDSKFNKKLTYRLQQSIYRALLFNMTGEIAKSISILPISITTDMDGNILSAESAARLVNNEALREMKNKLLALEKATTPDKAKISELEKKIKDLEKATTVPLQPIDDATLAEYGVVMKAPNLPENLKPENVGQEKAEPKLTPEQVAAEIKKIKKKIAETDKKLAALPNGGVIAVGDMITMSPQYDKLNAKKMQLEADLAKLEKPGEPEQDPIDDEINALKKGVKDAFPAPETITSAVFKELLNKMKSADTLAALEEAYTDAVIAITAETDVTFADLVENVYTLRKMALNVDTSEENIGIGDYLISKNPIFGVTENEIVVVKKKADGKITVNQVENIENGKPRQKTFTDAQIKAGFTKTTEEALKQEEEIMEPTQEEEENSNISKSSLKDFADNPELIDKAKQNAASMSKKDRLAALKNKNKEDNINNCKPK